MNLLELIHMYSETFLNEGKTVAELFLENSCNADLHVHIRDCVDSHGRLMDCEESRAMEIVYWERLSTEEMQVRFKRAWSRLPAAYKNACTFYISTTERGGNRPPLHLRLRAHPHVGQVYNWSCDNWVGTFKY